MSRRALAIALCSAAFGLGSIAEQDARSALIFTHNYEADVLPTAATPVWTSGGSFANGTPTVSPEGVLRMDTGSNIFGTAFFSMTGTPWDGNSLTGSTVEFRVRQVSGTSRFQIGLSNWGFDLLMSTTRAEAATAGNDLVPTGGPGVDLDLTEFHTFRLVMSAGASGAKRSVDVYVDGATTPAFQLFQNNSTANRILMGDGASSGIFGVSEYDYIRWTNAEATPPTAVPEPGTTGGMLLIGGGLLSIRRRRRG